MPVPSLTIRAATAADDAFILGLVPRFAAFPLPAWRRRSECLAGIRRDLEREFDAAAGSDWLFIAEGAAATPLGFMRLQRTTDFFIAHSNCHLADLAVAAAHEGQGVGRALLAHAERWAREHGCALLTLAVLPGNTRARALYEAAGFDTDLLRLAKPLR